jgi:hypothetical protein
MSLDAVDDFGNVQAADPAGQRPDPVGGRRDRPVRHRPRRPRHRRRLPVRARRFDHADHRRPLPGGRRHPAAVPHPRPGRLRARHRRSCTAATTSCRSSCRPPASSSTCSSAARPRRRLDTLGGARRRHRLRRPARPAVEAARRDGRPDQRHERLLLADGRHDTGRRPDDADVHRRFQRLRPRARHPAEHGGEGPLRLRDGRAARRHSRSRPRSARKARPTRTGR